MATATSIISAIDLAKHVIWHFDCRKQPVSNLKLQKLLYYCQGWHLGIVGSPIFKDQIQAWIHGPVVPVVFQEYRSFRWSPISGGAKMRLMATASMGIVEAVLNGYGDYSAVQLEELSHKEEPWKSARTGLASNCPSTAEITHASMRKYFAKLAA